MELNETAMQAFAQQLASQLQVGDVIVLTGDLGAGKTSFTKGIAKGLGIDQMIKSPTYTIVRAYESGRLPLYHMDVYRASQDPDSFDLDDYLFGDGVSVIEWGSLLGDYLPDEYLEIVFEKKSNSRLLQLKAHGKRYETYGRTN